MPRLGSALVPSSKIFVLEVERFQFVAHLREGGAFTRGTDWGASGVGGVLHRRHEMGRRGGGGAARDGLRKRGRWEGDHGRFSLERHGGREVGGGGTGECCGHSPCAPARRRHLSPS